MKLVIKILQFLSVIIAENRRSIEWPSKHDSHVLVVTNTLHNVRSGRSLLGEPPRKKNRKLRSATSCSRQPIIWLGLVSHTQGLVVFVTFVFSGFFFCFLFFFAFRRWLPDSYFIRLNNEYLHEQLSRSKVCKTRLVLQIH